MLERFLSSKTRVRLLTLFLTNPEKEFYLRELERLVKITTPSITRELKNLEAAGFLKAQKRAQTRYYRVNKEHPLFEELKSMVYKTEALGDIIRLELGKIADIEATILYGSIAKNQEDAHSDLDLLIIGKPDEDKLYRAISEIEKKLDREINFVTFKPDEWKQKIKEKNSFALGILQNKIIPLMGEADVLRRIS